jgi:multimeric flavodoxin WrbA
LSTSLWAPGQRGARREKIILSDHRILPCRGHDECQNLAVCRLDDDLDAILDKFTPPTA